MLASKPLKIEDVSTYYKVMKYSEDCDAAKKALEGEGANMNISFSEVKERLDRDSNKGK